MRLRWLVLCFLMLILVLWLLWGCGLLSYWWFLLSWLGLLWLSLLNLLLRLGLLSLWLSDSWGGWLSRSWSWLIDCYDTSGSATSDSNSCNCHADLLSNRGCLNCSSNLRNTHALSKCAVGFKCFSAKRLFLTENLANCSCNIVNLINPHNNFLSVLCFVVIS